MHYFRIATPTSWPDHLKCACYGPVICSCTSLAGHTLYPMSEEEVEDLGKGLVKVHSIVDFRFYIISA